MFTTWVNGVTVKEKMAIFPRPALNRVYIYWKCLCELVWWDSDNNGHLKSSDLKFWSVPLSILLKILLKILRLQYQFVSLSKCCNMSGWLSSYEWSVHKLKYHVLRLTFTEMKMLQYFRIYQIYHLENLKIKYKFSVCERIDQLFYFWMWFANISIVNLLKKLFFNYLKTNYMIYEENSVGYVANILIFSWNITTSKIEMMWKAGWWLYNNNFWL